MRFVRFKDKDSDQVSYGALIGEEISFIDGDSFTGYQVGKKAGHLRDFILLSPCLPGKILALAANYRGATGVTEDMDEPVVFLKSPTSITGPYGDIVSPFEKVRVWGECELGIVVSKRICCATVTEAKRAIFGYLCANDVTAENIHDRDHHLARSKGADTFCPVGPWIDTEFNPDDAQIQGFQNSRLIRQGNLRDRIWKEAETLSWLSKWVTLNPGDLVLTGTPSRVVEKTFLKDGDVYEVKIEGLGIIRNRFVSEERI